MTPLGPWMPCGGIPDLGDVLVGPGDAAVDLLVLPEAAPRLERHLDVLAQRGGGERPHVARGQVVAQARHQVGRHAVEAVVAPDRAHVAAGVGVRHLHAVLAQPDLADDRPELDRVPHPAQEGVDDAVHAAHGLHHGRGLIHHLAPVHVLAPEVGVEELREAAHRLADAGCHHAAAGVSGALRTAVGERLVEVAVHAQEGSQPLLVAGVETGVEVARVDGLRQQLGHEAAGVRHVLPAADGPPAEGGIVLDPGVAVVVDEDLEADAELAAVAEQARVAAGNPCGAGVEVEVGVVIELADLPGPHLVDDVAAPQGQVASSRTMGGFEDRAAMARPAQLVRRRQPGDARADDDDVARPPLGGAEGDLARPGHRWQEPQGGSRGVHGGRPAGRADGVQQLAAGDASVHRWVLRG